MYFKRHAKNRLRRLRLTQADVEFVVQNPLRVERDTAGNWRYVGQVEGKWIRVVVAEDDPDVVITVHPRRRTMKADYDSEANALSIDLIEVDRWDDGDSVDKDGQCNVAFSQGRVANVELLHPSENLELLSAAAKRFDLDGEGLLAAARAALAAPDRLVTLGLSRRLAGSS